MTDIKITKLAFAIIGIVLLTAGAIKGLDWYPIEETYLQNYNGTPREAIRTVNYYPNAELGIYTMIIGAIMLLIAILISFTYEKKAPKAQMNKTMPLTNFKQPNSNE